MKKFSLLIIFLFSFISCGEMSFAPAENSSGISKQDVEQMMQGSLFIPDPMSFGGTKYITYNGVSYKIGYESTQAILNQINNLNQGAYNIRFRGRFTQETGYMPNPTVTFDVVHLTEFVIP
jgi:hypothetical protein